MGKLILIRHGHTPLNGHGSEERLRSWLDVPLDEQGLQEAAETAEKIANYRVTAIFSSDLRRARQTAEITRQKTTGAVINTRRTSPMESRRLRWAAVAGDHPVLRFAEPAS